MAGRPQPNDEVPEATTAKGRQWPQSRRLLVIGLFAVSAVFVAGALFMHLDTNAGISGFEEADRGDLFPELTGQMDNIGTLKVEAPSASYRLERSDGGWRLVEWDGYPVPDASVTQFLEAFSALKAVYVSTQKNVSYENYGVARKEASATGVGAMVSVLDLAGNLLTRAMLGYAISVPGNTRKLTVVRRDDGPRMWMVDDALEVPGTPMDWLDRRLIDVPKESVARLTITPPDDRPIVIERTSDDRLVLEKGLPAEEELREPGVLDRLVEIFENLTFIDVRAAAGLEALDPKPWQSELTTKDGLTYQVHVYRTEKVAWANFFASASDGEQAQHAKSFNARHAAWAYRLPIRSVNLLTTKADQLVK